MSELICRLQCTGIAAHEACRIVADFLKVFGYDALIEYIKEREADTYVD